MDLFIKPLEFEKTAYMRVSESPTEWTRDVMEQFYNAFPYFMSYPVRVDFTQRDDQKGYAVGNITVEQKVPLVVPIVIKNRELYPFDLAIWQGTIIPLTTYTINTYISGKTPFTRTVSREQGDITTLLFGQAGMGYMKEMPIESYKMASLLEQVLPLSTEAERLDVLETISNDERIAEGFKVNGTGESVIKIASETTDSGAVKTAELASQKIDRDIWHIYKSGPFEYTGIFGNSKIDDPKEFTMTANDVVKIGQLTKVAERPIVKTAGVDLKAVLPIRGMEYDLAIVDDAQDFAYIDKVANVNFDNSNAVSIDFENAINKDVVINITDTEFSEPFHVDRVWKNAGVTYVEGSSALTKHAYAIMDGLEDRVEESGHMWLPSESTHMIELGKLLDAKPNVLRTAPHSVTKTAAGYLMRGDVLGKYVKTHEPVEYKTAAWALVQCGASEDQVEKLGSMREGSTMNIWNDIALPTVNIEKIASEYDTMASAEAAKIKKIARNFVKEASVIPDNPTVDKVLSLNFINKESLNVFVGSVDTLETAAMYLADMLLKSRIGIDLVQEEAIRKVMHGLLEIIEILRGVSNVKENK